MGGVEATAPAVVEPSLKYHPEHTFALTTIPMNLGVGHFQSGSLTGAVSSQRVTEECKGTLSVVGHHAFECNGIRVLDCETYMSSRNESWS